MPLMEYNEPGRASTCVTAKRKDRRKAEEKTRKETRKERAYTNVITQTASTMHNSGKPTLPSEHGYPPMSR